MNFGPGARREYDSGSNEEIERSVELSSQAAEKRKNTGVVDLDLVTADAEALSGKCLPCHVRTRMKKLERAAGGLVR